jgi:hypothetical protein
LDTTYSKARELALQHMRTVTGAFWRLLEFLDHPIARQVEDVVDEDNAIQML